MKYEHREHFSLIAVTDTKFEKPRFLINLNPSVFTPNELMSSGIIVRNELKRMLSSSQGLGLSIKPGLNIAILNLRDGQVRYRRFDMNMDPKIFREYHQEVQTIMESFFGMTPEKMSIDVGQLTADQVFAYGEASRAYVNQDR